MDTIFTFENLIKFSTLSSLEVILGIDNVIFLAIVVYNIPEHRRARVRFFGLSLAILLRILMLFGVSWLIGLTTPLFSLFSYSFSARAVLLFVGGLFLIVKSLVELKDLVQTDQSVESKQKMVKRYNSSQDLKVIMQIIFVDLVLSFDSVIVAVGMVNELYLIIPAILLAMVVMLMSARAIGDFMYTHPNIKVLGLAFVLLIGIALMLGGLNINVPKGYLYSSMLFAVFVELLNIAIKKRSKSN